jgi:hypothetical protein
MGNGTKIPNWVSESVRARATVAVTVFRDLTSGLSRKKGKLNTEEYRKLKMLKFLEFLDNSYTRAPRPASADTGEGERRMVSSTSCSIMRSDLFVGTCLAFLIPFVAMLRYRGTIEASIHRSECSCVE